MRIDQFLKDKHISLYSLAEKSGLNYSVVYNIMKGKSDIRQCKLDTAARLADALRISIDDLMLLCKKNYSFTTSLLGKHNITNILIGIGIALELGNDIEDIVRNVKKINQVQHRLEVKKINGYTFIDDAFNSNPVGSKMALDVLAMMDGKRVIVTPGMIDLGEKEDEINREFGEYMKGRADKVILVGEKQTRMIKKAINLARGDVFLLGFLLLLALMTLF